MLVLVSGSFRQAALAAPGRVGLMLAPRNRNGPAAASALGLPWAADNGAYSGFDPAVFRTFLGRLRGLPGCLFVVCPDVWGDAAATLALWGRWGALVRACGQPVAFVAQDGCEGLPVPWDALDCLFVGGTDPWRRSQACRDVMAEAGVRGKWLHLGRVNTLRRLRSALDLGCNSVDGSAWSRRAHKYMGRLASWLRTAEGAGPTLF